MGRGYGAWVADPLLRPSSEVVSVAEALELVTATPETIGVLAGRPLLAVDLGIADPAAVSDLAEHTRSYPCVTVALSPEPAGAKPPGFDVVLAADDEAALDAVVAGVARAPQAAVVLVQVLRMGRGRPLDEGLAIESLAYATLQGGAEHRAWLAGHRPKPRPAPSHSPVATERRGGTLIVTLRRPEVRNAVDIGVRDGLVEAFDLAAHDPTIEQVELRGEGPDFSSGGDLTEFGTTPDAPTGHLVRSTRSPARALAAVADRTTAYVHGASIGAGIELAALARRVVATPDATFRLPELGLGLIPGAGGTATIPRRIGPQRTAWMALTGAAIDAPTALAWGLVDVIT
jgi:enoyl-CoA hydratase/carnithine racemase